MIERFEGETGKRLVKQEILKQQCVSHNESIADKICDVAQVLEIKAGQKLIEQNGRDNCIYFILMGRFSVRVHEREMAVRGPRQHVGEIATIDPSGLRTASVVALEEGVVVRVEEPAFAAIANYHPEVWRCLAVELCSRLTQRNQYVRKPNPRPVIFVASSTEGLRVAELVQLGLTHDDFLVQLWTNNVFVPGNGTMEALEQRVSTADFGIVVCTPDDRVINEDRHVDLLAPRDNVIFELGMCVGALGRQRAYLVRPRSRDLKIPTDFLGITDITYRADDPANLVTHLSPVCTQIRMAVESLGVR